MIPPRSCLRVAERPATCRPRGAESVVAPISGSTECSVASTSTTTSRAIFAGGSHSPQKRSSCDGLTCRLQYG
jgi:hypothetical protein